MRRMLSFVVLVFIFSDSGTNGKLNVTCRYVCVPRTSSSPSTTSNARTRTTPSQSSATSTASTTSRRSTSISSTSSGTVHSTDPTTGITMGESSASATSSSLVPSSSQNTAGGTGANYGTQIDQTGGNPNSLLVIVIVVVVAAVIVLIVVTGAVILLKRKGVICNGRSKEDDKDQALEGSKSAKHSTGSSSSGSSNQTRRNVYTNLSWDPLAKTHSRMPNGQTLSTQTATPQALKADSTGEREKQPLYLTLQPDGTFPVAPSAPDYFVIESESPRADQTEEIPDNVYHVLDEGDDRNEPAEENDDDYDKLGEKKSTAIKSDAVYGHLETDGADDDYDAPRSKRSDVRVRHNDYDVAPSVRVDSGDYNHLARRVNGDITSAESDYDVPLPKAQAVDSKLLSGKEGANNQREEDYDSPPSPKKVKAPPHPPAASPKGLKSGNPATPNGGASTTGIYEMAGSTVPGGASEISEPKSPYELASPFI